MTAASNIHTNITTNTNININTSIIITEASTTINSNSVNITNARTIITIIMINPIRIKPLASIMKCIHNNTCNNNNNKNSKY